MRGDSPPEKPLLCRGQSADFSQNPLQIAPTVSLWEVELEVLHKAEVKS